MSNDPKDAAGPDAPTALSAEGTGGLTFEAPAGPVPETADIGFAPDLEEGELPALPVDAVSPVGPPPASPGPSTGLRPARGLAGLRPRVPQSARGDARYPLAEAAIAALTAALTGRTRGRETGTAPAPTPADPGAADDDDGPPAAFDIGPGVMRAPAPIARPTPPPPEPSNEDEAPPAEGSGLMMELVDMCLVGSPDDGGHEVHLMFKEDVVRGLYVRLKKQSEGLFATFTVSDATARRHIEGNIESFIRRLEGRGMKIAGHKVEVGDTGK